MGNALFHFKDGGLMVDTGKTTVVWSYDAPIFKCSICGKEFDVSCDTFGTIEAMQELRKRGKLYWHTGNEDDMV